MNSVPKDREIIIETYLGNLWVAKWDEKEGMFVPTAGWQFMIHPKAIVGWAEIPARYGVEQ